MICKSCGVVEILRVDVLDEFEILRVDENIVYMTLIFVLKPVQLNLFCQDFKSRAGIRRVLFKTFVPRNWTRIFKKS